MKNIFSTKKVKNKLWASVRMTQMGVFVISIKMWKILLKIGCPTKNAFWSVFFRNMDEKFPEIYSRNDF